MRGFRGLWEEQAGQSCALDGDGAALRQIPTGSEGPQGEYVEVPRGVIDVEAGID